MGPESTVVDTLALTAAGSPVDFDVTLFMMLAVFVGLLVILNKIVFQPYLKLRDVRDERTDDARQSAREMQVRAEEILDRYEDQLTEARETAAASRTDVRQAAKDQESEILSAARNEVNLIVSKSREDLDRQLATARAALTKEAEVLSSLIVDRVLAQ